MIAASFSPAVHGPSGIPREPVHDAMFTEADSSPQSRHMETAVTDAERPAQKRTLFVVEVEQRQISAVAPQEIVPVVRGLLSRRNLQFKEGPITWSAEDPEAYFLDEHVKGIQICDTELETNTLPGTWLMSWQVELDLHVYQLNDEGPADAEDDGGDGAAPAYSEWQLPATAFCGLWEALVCEQGIKRRLLQYAATALHFGQLGVAPHIVAFNRTVLLHGPPGSGKTSLCKALAQRLAIRLGHRFARSQLIEVNAHSLFSKWFSESGKLVAALFARIRDIVEDDDTLVFVLIDEVESLTAARRAAVSGAEPADAVRAVNALLTALDALRTAPNVMLLTTSNITAAIDAAFLDRIDIRIRLGPPDGRAIYEILRSCVAELQRAGVVSCSYPAPPAFQELRPQFLATAASADGSGEKVTATESLAAGERMQQQIGQQLREVAEACQGMSGRALRKLPFLAHIDLAACAAGGCEGADLPAFLAAMLRAAGRERAALEEIDSL